MIRWDDGTIQPAVGLYLPELGAQFIMSFETTAELAEFLHTTLSEFKLMLEPDEGDGLIQ